MFAMGWSRHMWRKLYKKVITMLDEKLSLISNLCQLASFAMLLSEATNKEILQELKAQDRFLEIQTNNYLKEILNRLDRIEKSLEEKGIL